MTLVLTNAIEEKEATCATFTGFDFSIVFV